MAGSTHRVQKVVFDLACGDQATAFKARRRLAHAFADSLRHVLEEVFDGHSPNGRPYRIKRMEVDLGVLDLERADDLQLRELLLNRLRRKFLELGHDDVTPVAETLPAADAFIRFLVTGRVRWDSQAQTLPEMERMILDLDEADNLLLARRLIQVFSNRAARIRFGHQFGLPFFLWIVGLLHPDASRILETAALRLGIDLALPEIRSKTLDAIVTAVTRSGGPEPKAIDRALEKVVTGSEDAKAEEPDAPPAQDEDDDSSDVSYTKNAGIVILHPFLERFFRTQGLLNDDTDFSSTADRARAIHLLHYLARGSENPEEHELLLEKVLCGWPIDTPLQKELELMQVERAESEVLLTSVIEHWGKLGNTSPDGLRGGFLQREGRLVKDAGRWELTVEQRGVDVLLTALPWSLHRIDLPWMASGLFVDWA